MPKRPAPKSSQYLQFQEVPNQNVDIEHNISEPKGTSP
jgi:hypothetical protein